MIKLLSSMVEIDNKNNLEYKKKLSFLRISRLGAILLFSFFVLFYIGLNSDYLIKTIIKYICLVLCMVSLVLFVIFILKYTKMKDIKLKAKRHIMNVLTCIYCIFCIALLVILYGPYSGFREWLITTAMGTMTHHYLCEMFYDNTTINKVLSSNYIEDTNEETDAFIINQDDVKEESEWTEYEHKLFDNHTTDEIYRKIEFKVRGQRAWIIAVYDPKNLSVVCSKNIMHRGEMLVSMAKRTKALIAVNGGRFYDPNHWSNGGIPNGVTIMKGKIISDREYKNPYGVIGINNDNQLVLYKNKKAKEILNLGVRDAVTSKPFLIVNGKAMYTSGNGGYGFAARTAIGQRADGTMLLLVVECNDARTIGASMKDLTTIFTNYGAVNAAALDGGTSSVLVENGKMINDPINDPFVHETRKIPTGFIVTRPNLIDENSIKELENLKVWEVLDMMNDVKEELKD